MEVKSPSLRVMSYNIRNNANDGPDHWIHRKEFWASTVRAFDPDLLGLQEVGLDQHAWIVEHFQDYDWVGATKDAGGERVSIFFRRDRFERIHNGEFWLSETPMCLRADRGR